MLAELFTYALAALGALAWVGACLLPLAIAWGLWLWFKSPTEQADLIEQAPSEHDALIAECEALLAESRALQAIRR